MYRTYSGSDTEEGTPAKQFKSNNYSSSAQSESDADASNHATQEESNRSSSG